MAKKGAGTAKGRRRGKRIYACRASFLTMVGEVRRALRDGHSVRAIHEQKRERLAMSYRSFARYVQLYIGDGCAKVAVAAPPAAPSRSRGGPLKVTLGPVTERIRDTTEESGENLV